MKNRSCFAKLCDSWIKLLEDWTRASRLKCYFAFSKAFNSRNHRLLQPDLGPFGIPWQAYKLVKDYLAKRSFGFKLRDKRSVKLEIVITVPQEPLLRALLFLIFITGPSWASK